jgi:hypothetical protein
MALRIFSKKEDVSAAEIKKELSSCLDQVKEELVDHLDTINENTNEIQSNYNFLCEIDAKIDKLNQRIDEIQLVLKNFSKNKEFIVENGGLSQPLSVPERELFLVLYTTENVALSYRNIAERLGFSESTIRDLVFSIIERGIPIIKEYKHGKAFIKLDNEFRELQAKENVLKIDQTTLHRFQVVD